MSLPPLRTAGPEAGPRSGRALWLVGCLTVVSGQTPAGGHAGHASREVVGGLGHAHGGNPHVQLGGGGQLDEQDVVVDGEAVVLGVLEHLTGSDIIRTDALAERRRSTGADAYLADRHGLDGFSVGGAVVFPEDHTVRGPADQPDWGHRSVRPPPPRRLPARGVYLTLQWAAVTTQFSLMREPPQKWKPV